MRRCAGWVHPQQVAAVDGVTQYDKRARKTGLCGIIYIPRTHLGAGLVAHELSHAAFRYCERRRLRIEHWKWGPPAFGLSVKAKKVRVDSSEEVFCDVVEHLSRQFWSEIFARGLDKPKGRT
jgi:hypothetical protein